jgi:GT2 family glycosyltransferase
VSSVISPPLQHSGAKSVAIVILNWNSIDDTLSAVDSVLRMDYPNYRLVVIDNGSTDGSAAELAKIEDDRVSLIRSQENLGFTGGCNLGLDWAIENEADYVWLLNSDSVTEVSTLSSLVRVAEADHTIGMVSPVIASLQQPSRLIYAGGFYNAQGPSCEMTRDVKVGGKWAAEHSANVLLLGTALLIKVELVCKIGKLDDSFFAYWEDIDFSMRSNKAGFRNAIDFDSTVSHSEKFPTDRPQDIKPHYWYYLARNEIRFWKKHLKFSERPKPLWWAYILQLGHLKLLNGSETSRQAALAGIWDGWLDRRGPYHADRRMPRLVASLIERHSRKTQK